MKRASLLGNKWEVLKGEFALASAFNQKLGLTFPVASVLSTNPVLNVENIESFLNPQIRNLMPNPFASLLDVDLAVLRIIKAIQKKEKIVIFGDYDVDGATSCAILKRFFKMVGVEVQIYIPDRIKEGYGPNSNALLQLRKNGADLVITVDCGTVAFEPLAKANEAGLEIIVIDHHIGVKEKPESIAVINPNRWDETSPLTYLCGAGVSFMLIVALNATLRKNNFYIQQKIKEPNLLLLIDLVALGTVCDVMLLTGLNRAFVKTGIEVIKAKTNVGIKALLSVAGVETEISEFTLGFILGPRINAGGRIGKSDLGARLLSTESEEEALQIAKELHALNSSRKEMEEDALNLAITKIEASKSFEKNIIFVEDESFHQGIIGILAARIKERYNKPVAVFAKLEGYLKASLRGTENVDLGEMIHKANAKGLLIAGGGHAAAGGLSVLQENYFPLWNFCQQEVSLEKVFERTIFASYVLTLNSLNLELYNDLKKLSPFGNGNPKPLFMLKNLAVLKVDVLKEAHAAMILKDELSGKTLKAMFFKAASLGILPNLVNLTGKKIDCIGELALNEWNGNQTLNFHLYDLAV